MLYMVSEENAMNVEEMLTVVQNVYHDFSYCFTVHHTLSKLQK